MYNKTNFHGDSFLMLQWLKNIVYVLCNFSAWWYVLDHNFCSIKNSTVNRSTCCFVAYLRNLYAKCAYFMYCDNPVAVYRQTFELIRCLWLITCWWTMVPLYKLTIDWLIDMLSWCGCSHLMCHDVCADAAVDGSAANVDFIQSFSKLRDVICLLSYFYQIWW